MTHDHAVWLATGLMQDNQICKVIGLCDLYQIFQNEATSVNSNSIRDNKFHFLLKLSQPLACIARCGN